MSHYGMGMGHFFLFFRSRYRPTPKIVRAWSTASRDAVRSWKIYNRYIQQMDGQRIDSNFVNVNCERFRRQSLKLIADFHEADPNS